MSAMEKKEGKKNGFFSPVVKYFREVKSELKKVVFPTMRQTRINTTVVIVAVIVVGLIIGVLDLAFNTARNYIINYDSTQVEETTDAPTDEATENVMDPVDAAKLILSELDNYEYDAEGNAIDENGEIIVMDDGAGNTVELTAENVAQLRENAQAVVDGAEVESSEETEEPEGGNE